jgi:hypothetical protein
MSANDGRRRRAAALSNGDIVDGWQLRRRWRFATSTAFSIATTATGSKDRIRLDTHRLSKRAKDQEALPCASRS